MNILQKIFKEHYEEMIYLQHPRDSVIENVDKMINCGNPSFGGAMYGCGHCGNLKFVPFRCKSRFCPTCGNKYSIDRTTSMSFKIIKTPHRHCVFTIAEELRPFFLKDRSLLNCLFHCLLSEGGAGASIPWRKVDHFNYRLLRDSFQTALLSELHSRLGDSFKKVKSSIYANHKNGFYVRALPNKCEPSKVIKYIGRYLGRPVIATSRIDSYDGDFVTFHYNRHEDEKLITETVPVLDFISMLTQHIPEKHFKMIRYYGLYARHRKSDLKLHRAISKEKHWIFLSFNRWRDCILHSFGYDPLKCPVCGEIMLFLKLYYRHKPVPLHELYERVMRKHRSRSPSIVPKSSLS